MSDLGQKLIDRVRFHAAAQPDFVYESPLDHGTCVYVHGGCPSCLIGQALFDVGLIDVSFEHTDDNGLPVFSIVERLGLVLDPEERKWLREVQYRQDNHRPWGEAVSLADEYVYGNKSNWNVA